MLHKILGYRIKTRLGRNNVNILCEFQFQLCLLVHIKIRLFNRIQQRIIDLGIRNLQHIAAVFIVKRNRCSVIDCTLEVIDRNISTKCSLGNIVVLEQRRSGKTDTGRRRQQSTHIVGKNTVL